MTEKSIFSLKFYFLSFGPLGGNIEIQTYTVEELRYYNRGYPKFVRAVLSALTQGRMYDDSDPDAYQGKADFCWFVPANKVLLDDEPISSLIERERRSD